MARTIKTPPDSKDSRPKTAGGIIEEPEKDGIVKKVCGIITKENKKYDEDARTYFMQALW
jgi:hypothetical protein